MSEPHANSGSRVFGQGPTAESLHNLSARVLELGRQQDQHMNRWLTFSALTVLLALGVTAESEIVGIKIKPDVGAAIAYILSCAFYYRAHLSGAALSIWKEALRNQRLRESPRSVVGSDVSGPTAFSQTSPDVYGDISEFPGYIASCVMIKAEADRNGGLLWIYISFLYYRTIAGFISLPCTLAAVVWYIDSSPAFPMVSGSGLLLVMLGNGLTVFRAKRSLPLILIPPNLCTLPDRVSRRMSD
jgi:hypothetical protein